MKTDPVNVPDVGLAILQDRTQLEIPSRTDWIPPMLEFLRRRLLLVGSCDEIQAQRLLMGLHEGLTNAVVHGNLEIPSALKEAESDLFAQTLAERMNDPVYNHRVVQVGVTYDGDRWQWIISDEGPGFNFEAVLRRIDNDPENGFLCSGRGILMMRAFFDEVNWEAGGRRLILTWRPQTEKRRETRWPVRTRVQVAPIRGDGSVDWSVAQEAITQNLSQGGILFLQQTLDRADRVMLTLDVDGQPLHLPAQVRHWSPLSDGLIEIGCAFQMEPPAVEADAHKRVEEALQGLIDQVQRRQNPSDDRRVHPRLPFQQRIEILAETERAAMTGFTQDLSRGGVKFITTQELPPEERTLILKQPDGSPLRLRARILRCDRLAERLFDVAAAFVDRD